MDKDGRVAGNVCTPGYALTPHVTLVLLCISVYSGSNQI